MSSAGHEPSLKATWVGGVAGSTDSFESATRTLSGPGVPIPDGPVVLFDAPESDAGAKASGSTPLGGATVGRTTVLPRRTQAASPQAAADKPRFERVRALGEGAMGSVELVRDNDIRRTVAVKKLQPEACTEAAMLRFADEVRVVGQLEHPSIVPIYDVGVEQDGQIYLVMKHLQGETMEAIIEKLRNGDPGAAERFSIEHRVHLFLGVLDAIRYAHARGVLHRDIKPANIMIGPYGEVTIIDWGIARPLRSHGAGDPIDQLERTLTESHDQRLQCTQFGSLVGTPLYMSPEQATGRNDELDERSDVYSLGTVFYEWLSLRHPRVGKETMTELLASLITEDLNGDDFFMKGATGGAPIEYLWVAWKSVQRKREDRYATVAEFEKALREVVDGRIVVRCHVTLVKRVARDLLHWVDHHPGAFWFLFHGGLALVGLGLLGLAAWLTVRWLS